MNSALRYTQQIPAEKWEAIRDRVCSLPECECFYEPRGNHGLEGYSEGIKYRYELIPSGADDKPYYRVWPDSTCCPEYYETCSPRAFKAYFKIND